MKLALVCAVALLLLGQGGGLVHAGGPKCDRADSARCGMDRCRAMKDKDGKTNCNNACHKGCCGCPDGSDPAEGKCPRDEPREYPQEEQ